MSFSTYKSVTEVLVNDLVIPHLPFITINHNHSCNQPSWRYLRKKNINDVHSNDDELEVTYASSTVIVHSWYVQYIFDYI